MCTNPSSHQKMYFVQRSTKYLHKSQVAQVVQLEMHSAATRSPVHHCPHPLMSTRSSSSPRAIWLKKSTPSHATLLPAVHFLEQAFAGADFSTEKFSAALSLISAALFQCPKIAKFSVAHFFKLSCDLRCSFSIAKSRKILRCSSSDIWKGSKLNCGEY